MAAPPVRSDRQIPNLPGLTDEARAEQLRAANINPRTGLATDYLNHFNEAVMLLEMIPDMPECAEDFLGWQPLSYCEHFTASNFKARDLANVRLDPSARERHGLRAQARLRRADRPAASLPVGLRERRMPRRRARRRRLTTRARLDAVGEGHPTAEPGWRMAPTPLGAHPLPVAR